MYIYICIYITHIYIYTYICVYVAKHPQPCHIHYFLSAPRLPPQSTYINENLCTCVKPPHWEYLCPTLAEQSPWNRLCFNLRLQQSLIQLLHRGCESQTDVWLNNPRSLRCSCDPVNYCSCKLRNDAVAKVVCWQNLFRASTVFAEDHFCLISCAYTCQSRPSISHDKRYNTFAW